MRLPPVIERELRIISRKGETYWGRTGAAALGMGLASMFLAAGHLNARQAAFAGQATFRVLAFASAVYVLVTVLRSASEAFVREKREETLGLLFLTPLKPFEIILGKLAAHSLPGIYRFLAMVPVLGLPILAGGVGFSDFLVLLLGLANLVFLAAAIGLWSSVQAWDETRAGSIATAYVFVIVVLIPAAPTVAGYTWQWPSSGYLMALSPGYPVVHAAFSRTWSPWLIWASFLLGQVIAWSFLWLARQALPHCWQQKPESLIRPASVPAEAKPNVQPKIAEASTSKRGIFRKFSPEERRALLEQNPILWLAGRWEASFAMVWAVGGIVLIVPVLPAMSGLSFSIFVHPATALMVCYVVNIGLKNLIATRAGSVFAGDQQENTLELLLSTPITVQEMIEGHRKALWKQVRSKVQLLLCIEIAWLVISMLVHGSTHGASALWWGLGAALYLGFMIPDLDAVLWWGLWKGVLYRKAKDAQNEAMTPLILPWVPVFLFFFLAGLLDGGVLVALAMILWPLGSYYSNTWFIRRAKRNFDTKLRLYAVRRAAGEFEHYDWWKKVGRSLGRMVAGAPRN